MTPETFTFQEYRNYPIIIIIIIIIIINNNNNNNNNNTLLVAEILREQNKMSLFWAKTRLFDVKHPLCKMLERSFFWRVPTFYTEDA